MSSPSNWATQPNSPNLSSNSRFTISAAWTPTGCMQATISRIPSYPRDWVLWDGTENRRKRTRGPMLNPAQPRLQIENSSCMHAYINSAYSFQFQEKWYMNIINLGVPDLYGYIAGQGVFFLCKITSY